MDSWHKNKNIFFLSEVSTIIFKEFIRCRRFWCIHEEWASSALREDTLGVLASLRSQLIFWVICYLKNADFFRLFSSHQSLFCLRTNDIFFSRNIYFVYSRHYISHCENGGREGGISLESCYRKVSSGKPILDSSI